MGAFVTAGSPHTVPQTTGYPETLRDETQLPLGW